MIPAAGAFGVITALPYSTTLHTHPRYHLIWLESIHNIIQLDNLPGEVCQAYLRSSYRPFCFSALPFDHGLGLGSDEGNKTISFC